MAGKSRPRVAVFAKAPVAGAVKTRLAAGIGEAAALEFYRATLTTLLTRLAGSPAWELALAVTPDGAVDAPFFAKTDLVRFGQGGGDLGERMARVLAGASSAAPLVIVGSDIPDLDAPHVAGAFRALETHDLAIGPSQDGGYWLIGASTPPPDRLFDGVRWSSPRARADTLVKAAGLKVALLEYLEDVDDAAGYHRRSR